MTWVILDDNMVDHPKVASLTDRSFRLHVKGLSFCNRLLTDGAIPKAVAHQLVPSGKRYSAELVTAGIWDVTNDGYQVHDYDQYQPSRKQVLHQRAKNAERVSRWRARNGSSNGVTSTLVMPTPDPDPARRGPKEDQSIASHAATTDHQVADKTLSPAVQDSIERLHSALTDADKGTMGRLVGFARRGASQAFFEDARAALSETRPASPSRYACKVIENRLNLAPALKAVP